MNVSNDIKLVNDQLSNSYAPYSNFNVACLIVTNDLQYIYGVNVENASYGATICAERNAISTFVAKGYKKGDIKKIYITSSGDDITLPCGICLQVLNEFINDSTDIFLTNYKGEYKKYKLTDLLPYGFGRNNLGV